MILGFNDTRDGCCDCNETWVIGCDGNCHAPEKVPVWDDCGVCDGPGKNKWNCCDDKCRGCDDMCSVDKEDCGTDKVP